MTSTPETPLRLPDLQAWVEASNALRKAYQATRLPPDHPDRAPRRDWLEAEARLRALPTPDPLVLATLTLRLAALLTPLACLAAEAQPNASDLCLLEVSAATLGQARVARDFLARIGGLDV